VLRQLDLHDLTFVVHDWGGPVALRLAVEQPERVARLVILDTGLFTGASHMSDAWIAFRDFVGADEDLPIGFLVKGACARDMPHEVFTAYEAPVPERRSRRPARERSR
jgi:haloalkane dehalogenase